MKTYSAKGFLIVIIAVVHRGILVIVVVMVAMVAIAAVAVIVLTAPP